MVDEQACIDALRDAARELGASPTKAEYEALGLRPASATIIRTIGGWNDAKERAGLATNASTGSRVGPPPEGIDEEIRERWAELSVDQRWHYRNREWNTERTRRRRTELREWVNDRKASAGCERCEESDADVLDFHHQDEAQKDEKVSRLILKEAPKERLRSEIEKCTVLCANCHRREHVSPSTPPFDIELREEPIRLVAERTNGETFEVVDPDRRRAWANSYKETRGCANCEADDGAVLDFHHVDETEKDLTVSRLISEGYGTPRVYREIEQCEILCANCHRKHHQSE